MVRRGDITSRDILIDAVRAGVAALSERHLHGYYRHCWGALVGCRHEMFHSNPVLTVVQVVATLAEQEVFCRASTAYRALATQLDFTVKHLRTYSAARNVPDKIKQRFDYVVELTITGFGSSQLFLFGRVSVQLTHCTRCWLGGTWDASVACYPYPARTEFISSFCCFSLWCAAL